MIQDGRVPYDIALYALRMAVAELEDSLEAESLSWADDPVETPTRAKTSSRGHGGSRRKAE
jgi:hypothetical protein